VGAAVRDVENAADEALACLRRGGSRGDDPRNTDDCAAPARHIQNHGEAPRKRRGLGRMAGLPLVGSIHTLLATLFGGLCVRNVVLHGAMNIRMEVTRHLILRGNILFQQNKN
jgi:hypothetical protein